MAKTKYAHGRYILINRQLRADPWVKTSDLVEKIENEFGSKISRRQIENDLEAMKSDSYLNYIAPIEYSPKEKAYRYTDKEYSIEKFNLRDDEILALKFYAATLNQYRNQGLFKDFSNALQKVMNAVTLKIKLRESTDTRLIVQTDNPNEIMGGEFLPQLVDAIEQNSKVEFDYKRFNYEQIKHRLFSPYLLKEYKNRWYIIGKLEGQISITTFALDRMSNLSKVDEKFEKDNSFDHTKYFTYSFGITKPEESAKKVVMKFTPEQGNYIRSLPIHSTQCILKDTKKEFRISIEVIPSYELYEFILSQGSNVKILSPKFIAGKIKQMHQEASRQY